MRSKVNTRTPAGSTGSSWEIDRSPPFIKRQTPPVAIADAARPRPDLAAASLSSPRSPSPSPSPAATATAMGTANGEQPAAGASSDKLRHVESMSQLPSGAGNGNGKISGINAVVLGESLAAEENDLIFPSPEFSANALVSSPKQVGRDPDSVLVNCARALPDSCC